MIVINHLPTNAECFKVLEKSAYFSYPQNDSVTQVKFDFNSVFEARAFRLARTANNIRNKAIEDFMACDENGNFDYFKYNRLLKTMGVAPEIPTTQLDLDAQREVFGLYKNMTMEEEMDFLTQNIDIKKPKNKITKGQEKESVDIKLKHLCDRFGVDYVFANIFIDDIRNRFNRTKKDDVEITAARLLGIL